MIIKYRKQNDGLNEEASDEASIDYFGQDMTHQEFRADTDINTILARYGVGATSRQPEFGTETDYNLDLQQALNTVMRARQTWQRMPADLRARYKSWHELITAMHNGEIEIINGEPQLNESIATPTVPMT